MRASKGSGGLIGRTVARSKAAIRLVLPRRIKARAILAGPLRGYRIVTSWHDYPAALTGRTESALVDWIARNVGTGQTWIDVGAHYGYIAVALSRAVGQTGRVFAFEPVLATAAFLAETKEINGLGQLRVLPLALGSVRAVIARTELPVVRGMADSTIRPFGRTADLLVTSFDSVWPCISEGNARVDGIKIDVQGMEHGVLLGMIKALAEQGPTVVLEFHDGVDRTAIHELLKGCGYFCRGQLPTSAGESTLPAEPAGYMNDTSYVFAPAAERNR